MSKLQKIDLNVSRSLEGTINKKQFKNLKKKFLKSVHNKFRILLHKNNQSKIHEMLIFLKRDYEMPIHYNYNYDKSYYLIEGKFKLLFYDKKKKIIKKIKMDSKKKFFYRFDKKRYHKFMIETKYIIFLETSAGPFRGIKKL